MGILQRIIISDFRNIKLAELDFVPSVNCICGDNGQGKTNLLDAIYYLSMTKSAFASSDQYCVRHGCQAFSIAGTYAMKDGLSSKFVISGGDGGKTLKRDDKAVGRISSHIGILPIVIVSPQDSSLVSESGEERRRFVNAVLSQMDSRYLAELQKYNKLLMQRNRMLKDGFTDDGLMSIIEEQMDLCASYVADRRQAFARDLEVVVKQHYAGLSGGREVVGVEYRRDVEGSLAEALRRSRNRDLALKYTSVGIQRDDFYFSMDDMPIRRCGSQGQQKSFLVSLKLAQYDIMKQAYGFPPILLLDDVFDKLDVHRISNLLKMVSNNDFGQIFISDTNRERMELIIRDIAPDTAFFTAENGEYKTR